MYLCTVTLRAPSFAPAETPTPHLLRQLTPHFARGVFAFCCSSAHFSFVAHTFCFHSHSHFISTHNKPRYCYCWSSTVSISSSRLASSRPARPPVFVSCPRIALTRAALHLNPDAPSYAAQQQQQLQHPNYAPQSQQPFPQQQQHHNFQHESQQSSNNNANFFQNAAENANFAVQSYSNHQQIGGFGGQPQLGFNNSDLFPSNPSFPFNSSSSGLLPGNGAGSSSGWTPHQQNAYGGVSDPQQMQMDQSGAFQGQQQQSAYQMGGDVFGGQGVSGVQPRNNAFLEQQQLNKNQSPVQAADETSRKGLRSDASKANNNVNNQSLEVSCR